MPLFDRDLPVLSRDPKEAVKQIEDYIRYMKERIEHAFLQLEKRKGD